MWQAVRTASAHSSKGAPEASSIVHAISNNAFRNAVRLRRIGGCWVVLDTLPFNVIDHVPHVLSTSIGAQFDLVSTFAFRPGLILFEGVEDSRRTLILKDVDHAVIRAVIRKGEDMLPPTDRFNVRFA
jgi:hypothetical protein